MAWYIVLGVIVLAIAYVFYNYFRIKKMNEGTADMADMAKIIRDGATTFMKTEYKTIAIGGGGGWGARSGVTPGPPPTPQGGRGG